MYLIIPFGFSPDESEQIAFFPYYFQPFRSPNHEEVWGEQCDISVVIRAAPVVRSST